MHHRYVQTHETLCNYTVTDRFTCRLDGHFKRQRKHNSIYLQTFIDIKQKFHGNQNLK